MFKRIFSFDLPNKQSIFLWGARQTGKTFFLKHHFKKSIYFDLLDNEIYIRFTKAPYLIRDEILANNLETLKNPVIIDEIQKVPELLNEVHWLIENKKIQFILCGSSSRNLKKPSTNLLGGRAWPLTFYPLVFPEIKQFNLLKSLQHGMIPNHYVAEDKYINNFLQSYIDAYLAEEIRNEGLVLSISI